MPNFLLTPYDDRPGQLGDIGRQKYGRGTETYIYLPTGEEEEEYAEDEFDDNMLFKLAAKTDSEYINLPSSTPRGSRKYYSDMMMSEFAGHHRNPARKGISPYKQPKHSGPPMGTGNSGQAFKTTGNFVGIGTQYGSSRPHKILTTIEDDNVWDIKNIMDPMERSFLRHNNRVKKVLSILKEYLRDEIN